MAGMNYARINAARKRQRKWAARILSYLERSGPMTYRELRAHRKMANLEASDRWVLARIQWLEDEGLVRWDPITGTYDTP